MSVSTARVVTRKRFIAGAMCPGCNAMDTLAVWREDQVDVVACVKCGHHRRQNEQQLEKHLRPQEQVIGIFHP
ncbi:MAG: YheV family putative metal-binding protein [Serratia symbiotica]|nr:YheV family putative metal-binding protein [Serratia symbiotica]